MNVRKRYELDSSWRKRVKARKLAARRGQSQWKGLNAVAKEITPCNKIASTEIVVNLSNETA